MQSRNAISNLVNRYRAVLVKCNLLNTFGSLSVAFMFTAAGTGVAYGVDWDGTTTPGSASPDGKFQLSNGATLGSDVKLKASSPFNVNLNLGSNQFTIDSSTLTLSGANSADTHNYILGSSSSTTDSIDILAGSILNSTYANGTYFAKLSIFDTILDNNGTIKATSLSLKNVDFTNTGILDLSGSLRLYGGSTYSGGNLIMNGKTIYLGHSSDTQTVDGSGAIKETDSSTIKDGLTLESGGILVIASAKDSGVIQKIEGGLTVEVGANVRLDSTALTSSTRIVDGALTVDTLNTSGVVSATTVNIGGDESGANNTLNVTDSATSTTFYLGNDTSNAGALRAERVNISDGKSLNITDQAQTFSDSQFTKIASSDGQLGLNGGNLNVTKNITITDDGSNGIVMNNASGNISTNGVLTIISQSLSAGSVDFKGAVYNAGGDQTIQSGSITVLGDDPLVGNSDVLAGSDGTITIDKSAIFNLGSTDLADTNKGGTIAASLATNEGGEINVQAGDWVVNANKSLTNAGDLNISGGSVLNIKNDTGSGIFSSTGNLSITGDDGSVSPKYSSLDIDGNATIAGALTIATSNSLNVDGKLTYNSATYNAEGLSTVGQLATDTGFNIDSDNSFTVKGGILGDDVVSAVGKSIQITKGTLNLGEIGGTLNDNTIATTINNESGNVNVNGAWTVNSANTFNSAGNLTIGNGSNPSSLTIQSDTSISSGKDVNKLAVEANSKLEVFGKLTMTGDEITYASYGSLTATQLSTETDTAGDYKDLNIANGTVSIIADSNPDNNDITAGKITISSGNFNLGDITNLGGKISADLTNIDGTVTVNGNWLAVANDLVTKAENLVLGDDDSLHYENITFENNADQNLSSLTGTGKISSNTLTVKNTTAPDSNGKLSISDGTVEVQGNNIDTADIIADTITIGGGKLSLNDLDFDPNDPNNIINANINTSSTGTLEITKGTWEMNTGKAYTGSANNLTVKSDASLITDNLTFTDTGDQNLVGVDTTSKVSANTLTVDGGTKNLQIDSIVLQVNGNTTEGDTDITANDITVGDGVDNASLILGSNGGNIDATSLTTNDKANLVVDGKWSFSGTLNNNGGITIKENDSFSLAEETMSADDFLDSPDAMNVPVIPGANQIAMESNSKFHADDLTLEDNKDQTINLSKGQILSANTLTVNNTDTTGEDNLTIASGTLNVNGDGKDFAGAGNKDDLSAENIFISENGALNLGDSTQIYKNNTISGNLTSTGGNITVHGDWVNKGNISTDASDLIINASSSLTTKDLIFQDADTVDGQILNALGSISADTVKVFAQNGIDKGSLTIANGIINSVGNFSAKDLDIVIGTVSADSIDVENIGITDGSVTATTSLTSKDINITKGTVSANNINAENIGIGSVSDSGSITATTDLISKNINIINGTLNAGSIDAENIDIANGALNANTSLSANDINISGGTVSAGSINANDIDIINGVLSTKGDVNAVSIAVGANEADSKTGIFNLDGSGALNSHLTISADGANQGQVNIDSGIWTVADDKNISNDGILNIKNGSTLNIGTASESYIGTFESTGTLNIGDGNGSSNSTLNVNGSATFGGDDLAFNKGSLIVENTLTLNGNVNISGTAGSIDTGILKLSDATYNSTVSATTGQVIVGNGIGSQDIQSGSITVIGNKTSSENEIFADTMTISAGTLNLGGSGGNVNADLESTEDTLLSKKGTINVNKGEWIVDSGKSFTSGGNLNIGVIDVANLNIQGDATTTGSVIIGSKFDSVFDIDGNATIAGDRLNIKTADSKLIVDKTLYLTDSNADSIITLNEAGTITAGQVNAGSNKLVLESDLRINGSNGDDLVANGIDVNSGILKLGSYVINPDMSISTTGGNIVSALGFNNIGGQVDFIGDWTTSNPFSSTGNLNIGYDPDSMVAGDEVNSSLTISENASIDGDKLEILDGSSLTVTEKLTITGDGEVIFDSGAITTKQLDAGSNKLVLESNLTINGSNGDDFVANGIEVNSGMLKLGSYTVNPDMSITATGGNIGSGVLGFNNIAGQVDIIGNWTTSNPFSSTGNLNIGYDPDSMVAGDEVNSSLTINGNASIDGDKLEILDGSSLTVSEELTLQGDGDISFDSGSLNSKILNTGANKLTVSDGAVDVGILNAGADLTISGGTVDVGTLNASGDLAISGTGDVDVDILNAGANDLTISDDGTIIVNGDGKGSPEDDLVADNINILDGKLVLGTNGGNVVGNLNIVGGSLDILGDWGFTNSDLVIDANEFEIAGGKSAAFNTITFKENAKDPTDSQTLSIGGTVIGDTVHVVENDGTTSMDLTIAGGTLQVNGDGTDLSDIIAKEKVTIESAGNLILGTKNGTVEANIESTGGNLTVTGNWVLGSVNSMGEEVADKDLTIDADKLIVDGSLTADNITFTDTDANGQNLNISGKLSGNNINVGSYNGLGEFTASDLTLSGGTLQANGDSDPNNYDITADNLTINGGSLDLGAQGGNISANAFETGENGTINVNGGTWKIEDNDSSTIGTLLNSNGSLNIGTDTDKASLHITENAQINGDKLNIGFSESELKVDGKLTLDSSTGSSIDYSQAGKIITGQLDTGSLNINAGSITINGGIDDDDLVGDNVSLNGGDLNLGTGGGNIASDLTTNSGAINVEGSWTMNEDNTYTGSADNLNVNGAFDKTGNLTFTDADGNQDLDDAGTITTDTLTVVGNATDNNLNISGGKLQIDGDTITDNDDITAGNIIVDGGSLELGTNGGNIAADLKVNNGSIDIVDGDWSMGANNDYVGSADDLNVNAGGYFDKTGNLTFTDTNEQTLDGAGTVETDTLVVENSGLVINNGTLQVNGDGGIADDITGSVTIDKGTLTLGDTNNKFDNNTLNGNLTNKTDGTLNVNGDWTVNGAFSNSGQTNIGENSSLTVGSVSIDADLFVTKDSASGEAGEIVIGGGSFHIKDLTLKESSSDLNDTQTLDIADNTITTDTVKIYTDSDLAGELHIATGNLQINGIGEGNTALSGDKVSLSGGKLGLGLDNTSGGIIDTDLDASGDSTIDINGKWQGADGKTLTTGANNLNVNTGAYLGFDDIIFEADQAEQTLNNNGEIVVETLVVDQDSSDNFEKGGLNINGGKVVISGDADTTNDDILADNVSVNSGSLDLGGIGGNIASDLTTNRGTINVTGSWTMDENNAYNGSLDNLNVSGTLEKSGNLTFTDADGEQNIDDSGTIKTDSLTIVGSADKNELNISDGKLQVNGNANNEAISGGKITVGASGSLDLGDNGGIINSDLIANGGSINIGGGLNNTWNMEADNNYTGSADSLNVSGTFEKDGNLTFTDADGDQSIDDNGTIITDTLTVVGSANKNDLNISNSKLQVNGSLNNDAIIAGNITIDNGSLELGANGGNIATDLTINSGSIDVAGDWSMGANNNYVGSADSLNVNGTFDKDSNLTFTDADGNQSLDGTGTIETDTLTVLGNATDNNLNISGGKLQVNGDGIDGNDDIVAGHITVENNANLTLNGAGGNVNSDLTIADGGNFEVEGNWSINGSLVNEGGINIADNSTFEVSEATIDADDFLAQPPAGENQIALGTNANFHADNLIFKDMDADGQNLNLDNGKKVSANTLVVTDANDVLADLTISGGILEVNGDGTQNTDIKADNITIGGGTLSLNDLDFSANDVNNVEANINNTGGKLEIAGNWVVDGDMTTAADDIIVDGSASLTVGKLTLNNNSVGDQTLDQNMNTTAETLEVRDANGLSSLTVANGTLTILGDGIDNVDILAENLIVDSILNLYGTNNNNVIDADLSTSSTGTLNVNGGTWEITAGNTFENKGQTIIDNGSLKLNGSAAYDVEDFSAVAENGKIAILENGTFHADELTLVSTIEENLTIGGTLSGNTVSVIPDNLTIASGTLKVNGDGLSDKNNPDIEARKITVSGGTLNLSGNHSNNEIDITELNVAENGTLRVDGGTWNLDEVQAYTNTGKTVIGGGANQAHLNIGGDFGIDVLDFTDTEEAQKIAILDNGTLQVDDLTLNTGDTNDSKTLNIAGKLSADTLTVLNGVNSSSLIIAENSNLQVFGSLNDTNIKAVVANDITNNGVLTLGGMDSVGGAIHANITSTKDLSLASGKWTTAGKIAVQDGNFSVAEGASLDISKGTLSVASATDTFANAGILDANTASFGSFEDASTFNKSDNIDKTLNNTGLLKLHDSNLNSVTFAELQNIETTLVNEGVLDKASAALEGSNVSLVGVNITEISGQGLSDLTGYYIETTETVGSGTLGANSEIIAAGITGDSPSFVESGAYLELTGKNGNRLVGNSQTLTNNGGTVVLGENGQWANYGGGNFVNNNSADSNGLVIVNGILDNIETFTNNGLTLIGNSESSSRVHANNLAGTGTLLIDPAWNSEASKNTLANASNFVLSNTNNDPITNVIGVGQNSYMAVSSRAIQELEAEFYEAGMEFGNPAHDAQNVSAALFLDKGIDLVDTGTEGYLVVDGTITNASASGVFSNANGATIYDGGANRGDVIFAENSLLMINVGELYANSTVAINNTGSLSVDETSKLLLNNIGAFSRGGAGNGTMTLGLASSAGTGWEDNNIHFDSVFYKGTTDTSGGNVDIVVSQVKASEALEKLDGNLGSHIDQAIYQGLDNTAMNFVKDASVHHGRDGNVSNTKIIESAAKMAILSGVYGNMNAVKDVAHKNIQDRVSYFENKPIAYGDDSVGLWAAPMYQVNDTKDLGTGNFEYGYDGSLAGISAGGEYTFNNKFRAGVGFHMGSGDSESNGDLAATKNDYEYIGGSIYLGYLVGKNLGLSFDASYMTLTNEVSQGNTMGALKGDFDSSVLSAGLGAEYRILTESLDVIPRIGLRVNHYDVDAFNTNLGNSTIFENKASDATTVVIPVGVKFEKEVKTESGWKVNPSLDLGVKFAMGDTDIAQEVNLAGMSSPAKMRADVLDKVTFEGGLGVGVSKGKFDFNLDYSIQASEYITNHGVHATFSFKF